MIVNIDCLHVTNSVEVNRKPLAQWPQRFAPLQGRFILSRKSLHRVKNWNAETSPTLEMDWKHDPMYRAQKQVQALACSACLLEPTSWNPRYDNTTPPCRIPFFPQQALNLEWMEVAPVYIASALRTLFTECKCAFLTVPEHWLGAQLVQYSGPMLANVADQLPSGRNSGLSTVWYHSEQRDPVLLFFWHCRYTSFGPWCGSHELPVTAIGIKQELPSTVFLRCRSPPNPTQQSEKFPYPP